MKRDFKMNEWINIKDRVPNNVGAYPVVVNNTKAISAMYWNMDNWYSSNIIDKSVTHWMDLKAPIKK